MGHDRVSLSGWNEWQFSDGSSFVPTLQPLKLPIKASQNQSIKQAGDQPEHHSIGRLLDVSEHCREKKDQNYPPAKSSCQSKEG